MHTPVRLASGFGLAVLLFINVSGQLSGQVPSAGPQTIQAPKASTTRPMQETDPASDLGPQLRRFIEVLNTVETQGAERQPADSLIYQGAIPSMLRQLDPHTQFFEPSQFEQLRQMEQSEQKGFGSIVSVLPGQVIFLQTFPGTPTSKAGIQAGDELVAINNVAIGSLEPEQIIQLLTQARQEKITVFIRRV
jgi:carboxyl-terminal processing protease